MSSPPSGPMTSPTSAGGAGIAPQDRCRILPNRAREDSCTSGQRGQRLAKGEDRADLRGRRPAGELRGLAGDQAPPLEAVDNSRRIGSDTVRWVSTGRIEAAPASVSASTVASIACAGTAWSTCTASSGSPPTGLLQTMAPLTCAG